ncbi:uncharacterized protein B0H64DRAFT_477115 [Chaetomium fimeti]|uniref:Uncharacterized protein n=1 Tax=Chaetomium fimeti TaxID=1854472 RepID=A0AAE0HDI3_9PEZI|nr:hypothetical protein B0H64DRAFT_477115 [Chaetomium fimeti]
MTARAPRSMTPPSPGHGKAAKAAHIIKAAKELLVDAEIDDYVALVDENTTLRTENDTLEKDVERRDRRISVLLQKTDETEEHATVLNAQLKDMRDHIAGLSRKLSEATEKLQSNNKEMAGKEAAWTKGVATLKASLESERREHQQLKSFSIELMPVAKNQREISSRLNKIFASARSLAEAYFGDIPHQIRSNAALWDKIKEHRAVDKVIPLPLSDSPAANQMRTAAFLAVLAHEMDGHIFQPTYLLPDNAGLNIFINNLADDDSESEAHLRSVILRLTESLSDETNAGNPAVGRISTVVANVCKYVLHLIPEKSRSGFKDRLKTLCTEACEQWKFIQRLDGNIDADFDDAAEARPLYPPNTTSPPPSDPNTNQHPNAKPRPNGNNTNQSSNNHKRSNSNPTPTTTDLTDAVVIWPAFYNQSTHALETLVQGYLLTAGQVAVAKAEEKAQSTGQRRAQRQQTRSSRALSMSGGVAGISWLRERDAGQSKPSDKGK